MEVSRIREQLTGVLTGRSPFKWDTLSFKDKNYHDNICRTLALAFFHQSAMRTETRDVYRTVNTNQNALLSLDSVLLQGKEPYQRNPQWIIFTKFEQLTKQYLTDTTAIQPEWIAHLPYFQDAQLPKKQNGEYRQPQVQKAMAAARALNLNTIVDNVASTNLDDTVA